MNVRVGTILLATLLFPRILLAVTPSVSLTAKFSKASSTLRLTILPATSAAGCTYAIYAGASPARLTSALNAKTSIITVNAQAGTRSLSASALPLVRGHTKTLPFYFLVRTRCGSDTSRSNRAKVDLKASEGTTSVSTSAFQRTLKSKLLISTVTYRSVFTSLSFSQPLDLQPARDGTGRIFVAEQGGTIQILFPSGTSATASQFLDIGSKLINDGERGLLGLALHPNFAQNGFIYVNYSRKSDADTIIARFKVSSGDSNQADPSSELILLHVAQPFANHNGGGLAFGHDGFLFIALGDGGSGGDPLGNAQDRKTLLGKFLRIDVDNPSNGDNYGIPSSNPFARNSSGFREEIFAYGLRNPFRFSVDALTGKVWAGDVGQDAHEEVDIIQSGKNYGWNTMEGKSCYNPSSNCDRIGLTLPVTDYDHPLGEAVTGGYVYRGTAVPELKGKYLYGDFETGRLFALEAARTKEKPIELAHTSINISGFGQDDQNELYVISYSEGKLYRMFEK